MFLEVLWHLLAITCALAPSAVAVRIAPRVLPGYYSRRMVLLQVIACLLFLAVCVYGAYVCTQHSNSLVVGLFVPIFLLVSVVVTGARQADRFRLHYNFMAHVERATKSEHITMGELTELMRVYVWLYPGIELTALRVKGRVKLVASRRLIATLRVTGHSPVSALEVLRRELSVEPLTALTSALESVSVMRVGSKFTTRINARVY